MHVPEEMHDVFGPGQQWQVPLDDDAVETVIYKDQEAFKKLRKGFPRSPPSDVWLDTKIICQATDGIKAGSCVLCVSAPWRETEREIAMTENELAKEIVDAAFHIHTALGPGLPESVYDTVLAYELGHRGLRVVRQQPIPVVYKDVRIDTGFRADLVVEDKVIVEVKSVENLAPVHKKQLLTYLRLADKRLGLLINFHVALIKDGIARVVNGLEDDSHAKSPSRQDAQR
jgi:GxxExxY protein